MKGQKEIYSDLLSIRFIGVTQLKLILIYTQQTGIFSVKNGNVIIRTWTMHDEV